MNFFRFAFKVEDVRVRHSFDPEIIQALGSILDLPVLMENFMSRISDEIEEAGRIAAQTRDSVGAITTLITTLVGQAEASIGDENALREVLATMRANAEALAQAAQAGQQPPPVIEPPTDTGTAPTEPDTSTGGQAEDTLAGGQG